MLAWVTTVCLASDRLSSNHKILKLNVVALLELTHLFLAGMQQRRYGGIINLSSISAFQPIP